MEYVIYIYFVLLVLSVIYLAYVYSRDRNSYMKVACKRILTTIQCMEEDLTKLDEEIENLYAGYANNVPSVKKLYPNAVVWLEDVVYRINGDFKYARKLKPYINQIKDARNNLSNRYPFAECEKYQQEILGDLKKLEKSEMSPNENIVIDNLITRIRGEFFRLNTEKEKNKKSNSVSIFVTIVSIIVTIFSILK